MPPNAAWTPRCLLAAALLVTGLAAAVLGEATPDLTGLHIAGLSDLMTGWHRIEAITSDPAIDHVAWRVNGRDLRRGERFATDVYFGRTPQPRSIEALAYGPAGALEYTITTTVNAGGRARLLDFVRPFAGARVEGLTAVSVCAHAPSDRPVERVELQLMPVGGASEARLEMTVAGRGSCRQGIEYRAHVELSDEPAVLLAKLFTRRHGDVHPDVGGSLEEAILVNTPPAINDQVHVRLLEWPVHVARKGEAVRGLEASHFELYEDRSRCDIRRVLTPQVVPFRLGLVFDWSGSTALDADAEATAVSEFLDHLFDPAKDSALVWGIAHVPIPYLGWTGDREQLQDALDLVQSGQELSGGTALYDTLVRVLYEFQTTESEGIPAIIVLTDGIDTTSIEFTREQALDYARESGVRIEPIAVRVRKASGGITEVDEEFLQELADSTGGWLRNVQIDENASRLQKAATRLRNESESLRLEPGDLAQDPRFLQYLISERDAQAADLEAKAARLQRKNAGALGQIRTAFEQIQRDLSSGYVLVVQSRASRNDQWHSLEVRLTGVPRDRDHRIRAAAGIYW